MARSLEFAPKIAALADRVIHGMTMAGKYEYNAVHLRIEKDARDWSQIMGGEQVTIVGSILALCCHDIAYCFASLLWDSQCWPGVIMLKVNEQCNLRFWHQCQFCHAGCMARICAKHVASWLHV